MGNARDLLLPRLKNLDVSMMINTDSRRSRATGQRLFFLQRWQGSRCQGCDATGHPRRGKQCHGVDPRAASHHGHELLEVDLAVSICVGLGDDVPYPLLIE